ncbi:uncharacterized protein LOC107431517 isoform X1 [Ziziphus jujuba]|uniref:Uncharacterized protein LOC107431517 isoform X1 n=1 Tax=Ziziphus jujuba TaxID=326968 RepID=A0ABM3ZVR8_ZIZJJ|nr:uncharacterized protein LOC107431517 isoform X1 [Ziziphus jujuba]
MGKAEEQRSLPSTLVSHTSHQNADTPCPCGCRIQRLIGLRCIFVLLLSAALFLSAVFWLPPFLQFADHRDLDLDSKFKDHSIVASFNVLKPVSLLEDNISQLADDIFDEIGLPSTRVVILSLEPLNRPNVTKVVFGVDPDPKDSNLSEPAESLIRASFKYLVVRQTYLHLTASLFGDAYFFEVLKFPGGITIIPPQSVFLLQKVQILFNFTLNFSIYQIQVNFNELTSQLKSGLHLAPYENIYVSLSNSKGSTVAAPTTVQSSVLLAVGNTPSMQRLKQLAQTITGSHSRNLGLNNTVFGRVKQVRLSTILQHSLHGGDGGSTAWSPSPAPLPHPHHHRHHHHHHHHHHHSAHLAPAISPTPEAERGPPATKNSAPPPKEETPAPGKSLPPHQKSYEANAPGCRFRNRRSTGKERNQPRLAPTAAPNISPHYVAASPPKQVHTSKPIFHSVPTSSPLPSVVFTHVQPPSKSKSDMNQLVAPTPSTSSAGGLLLASAHLAFSLSLALVIHL